MNSSVVGTRQRDDTQVANSRNHGLDNGHQQKLQKIRSHKELAAVKDAIQRELAANSDNPTLAMEADSSSTRSKCWDYFSHVIEKETGARFIALETEFVACRACFRVYTFASGKGTSTLNAHTKSCYIIKETHAKAPCTALGKRRTRDGTEKSNSTRTERRDQDVESDSARVSSSDVEPNNTVETEQREQNIRPDSDNETPNDESSTAQTEFQDEDQTTDSTWLAVLPELKRTFADFMRMQQNLAEQAHEARFSEVEELTKQRRLELQIEEERTKQRRLDLEFEREERKKDRKEQTKLIERLLQLLEPKIS